MGSDNLKIIEVNGNNVDEFNKLVNQTGMIAIVKFYADWCGHCKILNPKWEIMTSELEKNKKLKGILASVSEKYKDAVQIPSNIDGFPTIRVYNSGKYKFDYRGRREISDLNRFVKSILGKKHRKTKKRRKKRKGKRKGKRRGKSRGGGRTRKKKNYSRSALRERFFKMFTPLNI